MFLVRIWLGLWSFPLTWLRSKWSNSHQSLRTSSFPSISSWKCPLPLIHGSQIYTDWFSSHHTLVVDGRFCSYFSILNTFKEAWIVQKEVLYINCWIQSSKIYRYNWSHTLFPVSSYWSPILWWMMDPLCNEMGHFLLLWTFHRLEYLQCIQINLCYLRR